MDGVEFPKIGRLFGKSDRHFILQQIQNTFTAHLEEH